MVNNLNTRDNIHIFWFSKRYKSKIMQRSTFLKEFIFFWINLFRRGSICNISLLHLNTIFTHLVFSTKYSLNIIFTIISNTLYFLDILLFYMPHQHLDPVTKFHSLLRYKKTRRTFAKCSSASDSLRRNKRYSPIISSIHGHKWYNYVTTF